MVRVDEQTITGTASLSADVTANVADLVLRLSGGFELNAAKGYPGLKDAIALAGAPAVTMVVDERGDATPVLEPG